MQGDMSVKDLVNLQPKTAPKLRAICLVRRRY